MYPHHLRYFTVKCILKRAKVIGPKGRELDKESIGSAKAARELNEHLRRKEL
ncbi:MAG: DUF188 domain-containing protein [Bdellovibrionales bacterium]